MNKIAIITLLAGFILAGCAVTDGVKTTTSAAVDGVGTVAGKAVDVTGEAGDAVVDKVAK